jgi:uncharacterized protein YceK
MKRIVIALIALMLLTGCTKVEEIEKPEAENVSRFVTLETTSRWKVVVDKDTHVMYAVSLCTYNAGNFTLLVDADGKPLIYKGEK